eukprot:Lithocolla_globosa_v1_NODE_2035_length_2198_cov_21.818479.p4 type:complete len:134 gc:universal NODE_2035_length_2198_cov_21.818479:2196-1795(-)
MFKDFPHSHQQFPQIDFWILQCHPLVFLLFLLPSILFPFPSFPQPLQLFLPFFRLCLLPLCFPPSCFLLPPQVSPLVRSRCSWRFGTQETPQARHRHRHPRPLRHHCHRTDFWHQTDCHKHSCQFFRAQTPLP